MMGMTSTTTTMSTMKPPATMPAKQDENFKNDYGGAACSSSYLAVVVVEGKWWGKVGKELRMLRSCQSTE